MDTLWIPAVSELAVAAILAASSSAKLGSFSAWRKAASEYTSRAGNLGFATIVPAVELGVSIALTLSIEPLAAFLATSLAVIFALAMVVGMRKGARDCGCFGSLARMPLDRAALARILGFAVLAFAGSSSRPQMWPTVLLRVAVVAVIGLVVLLASHRTELRRTRLRPQKDEFASMIGTEPDNQNLRRG